MCELYITMPVKILRFKVLVVIFIQVIVWLHSYSINVFVSFLCRSNCIGV